MAMINLVYSVYSKTGELLGGPFDTGTLWQRTLARVGRDATLTPSPTQE